MNTGRENPPDPGSIVAAAGESLRAELQATRERQERLRNEVRHLNERQLALRRRNRRLREAMIAAAVRLEEGEIDEAKRLLALGLLTSDQTSGPVPTNGSEAEVDPIRPGSGAQAE
jgi:hypothetical protein